MRKQILKEMSEISEPRIRQKIVNFQNFGKYVFSRTVMQKMLSEEIYKNVSNAINGREKIKAEYIDQAALRLLQLTGLEAKYVYSTLGLEQEYFVIDQKLRNLRPDLILLGKTVFGAPAPKG
ncbi:hypothetical protein PRO82_001915 [Candidatus Protochlamydia amoebophila]|uniref:glutamine synthetase III n=1 Tax=Candidatus Protochlamydia amoebophila TaxID=362787 RepID=UPI001BD8FB23|nr:glutamine synthetase III [Candidatus Protochlamydia amoebophila]MBS4164585.1 hypothetical protein [Candidatus Protochlamydia amoebophila]